MREIICHKYIGDRYRLKTLIGEGGMASVYAAVDEKLDRRVAIKILHSSSKMMILDKDSIWKLDQFQVLIILI